MSTTWQFFADAGLTTPLTQGGATQIANGPAVDSIIYFGSNATAKKLESAAAPGVDPVQVAVVDSDAGGGLAETAITLALSAAGLDTATPGAALVMGTTLLSGTGGAVAVFVRTNSGVSAPGTYSDLALRVPDIVESDQ